VGPSGGGGGGKGGGVGVLRGLGIRGEMARAVDIQRVCRQEAKSTEGEGWGRGVGKGGRSSGKEG